MRVQGLEAMKTVLTDYPRIARRKIVLHSSISAFHLENAVRRRLSGTGGNTLRVRSGRLRGSWKAVKEAPAKWRVSSDEPYNLIHELGGPIKRGGRTIGTMPARPFIAPAIKDWEPISHKVFKDQLNDAAKDAQRIADRLRRKGFTIPGGRPSG